MFWEPILGVLVNLCIFSLDFSLMLLQNCYFENEFLVLSGEILTNGLDNCITSDISMKFIDTVRVEILDF